MSDEYLQAPTDGSLDEGEVLQVIYLSKQPGLTESHLAEKHLVPPCFLEGSDDEEVVTALSWSRLL